MNQAASKHQQQHAERAWRRRICLGDSGAVRAISAKTRIALALRNSDRKGVYEQACDG